MLLSRLRISKFRIFVEKKIDVISWLVRFPRDVVFLSSLERDFSLTRSSLLLTHRQYLLHLSLYQSSDSIYLSPVYKVFSWVVSFRCKLTCARDNRLELTKPWFRIHGKHEDSLNLDVGYGFRVTLAGRPRGACSNRRGTADRIQKMQCLGYCDAIGFTLHIRRMFKLYYSNMIREISRGSHSGIQRERRRSRSRVSLRGSLQL